MDFSLLSVLEFYNFRGGSKGNMKDISISKTSVSFRVVLVVSHTKGELPWACAAGRCVLQSSPPGGWLPVVALAAPGCRVSSGSAQLRLGLLGERWAPDGVRVLAVRKERGAGCHGFVHLYLLYLPCALHGH